MLFLTSRPLLSTSLRPIPFLHCHFFVFEYYLFIATSFLLVCIPEILVRQFIEILYGVGGVVSPAGVVMSGGVGSGVGAGAGAGAGGASAGGVIPPTVSPPLPVVVTKI